MGERCRIFFRSEGCFVYKLIIEKAYHHLQYRAVVKSLWVMKRKLGREIERARRRALRSEILAGA
jgi:hypothetical protein